jgi:hypothetical protein
MRVTKQILLTLIIAWGSCAFANDGIDWPEGLKRNAARMVRLQYARGNWDQDIGRGGDYNLLLWYQVVSQLNIAKDSESLRAKELKALSDANLPAFLLVTGMREVELSEEEIIAVRAYCLERGGLLVCSNGGRRFDGAIRAVLGRCFPDSKLVDIPNDAPFFQKPFPLPNGAPPLWHHSGRRALGIKVNDRWVAFYHPGDLVDAWQDAHSGIPEATAIAAYKMGFNLLHYAYAQRDEAMDAAEQEH